MDTGKDKIKKIATEHSPASVPRSQKDAVPASLHKGASSPEARRPLSISRAKDRKQLKDLADGILEHYYGRTDGSWKSEPDPKEWTPRQRPPLEVRSSEGFYDIDGSWIPFAYFSGVADFGDAVAKEFLAAGGWHIEDFSTGLSVGRPKKGITDREPIYKAIAAQGNNKSFTAVLWNDARDAFCVLLALTPNLNMAATAEATGFARSTIYKLRRRGKMLLSQLDRMEAKLDKLDSRLAIHYPTPAEELGQALAEESEQASQDEKEAWTKFP
jgi:hypothetical protein